MDCQIESLWEQATIKRHRSSTAERHSRSDSKTVGSIIKNVARQGIFECNKRYHPLHLWTRSGKGPKLFSSPDGQCWMRNGYGMGREAGLSSPFWTNHWIVRGGSLGQSDEKKARHQRERAWQVSGLSSSKSGRGKALVKKSANLISSWRNPFQKRLRLSGKGSYFCSAFWSHPSVIVNNSRWCRDWSSSSRTW